MFNFFNPYTVWLGIAHIPLFLISLYSRAIFSPVRGWTGLSEATATRFSVLRTTKCDVFSDIMRRCNQSELDLDLCI